MILLPAEFFELAQQRFGVYAFGEGRYEITLARALQKLRDDAIIGLILFGMQLRGDLVQSGHPDHDAPHADLKAAGLLKRFH